MGKTDLLQKDGIVLVGSHQIGVLFHKPLPIMALHCIHACVFVCAASARGW